MLIEQTNHGKHILAFPSLVESEMVRLHPTVVVPTTELSCTQTLALFPFVTYMLELLTVTFVSE